MSKVTAAIIATMSLLWLFVGVFEEDRTNRLVCLAISNTLAMAVVRYKK